MAFDKYSELDTAKFMRDVEEMHGAPIFDNYSILDSARRKQQIEQALGVELSNEALLDPVRMMQEITVAVDEGGGEDAWPPTDAIIAIDFVNDRAWTEADGEVEIDTLVGADAAIADSGWGELDYDPDFLTANGYVDGPIGLIGATRSALLDSAGSTFRVQFATINGDNIIAGTPFALAPATDDAGLVLDFTSERTVQLSSYSGEPVNQYTEAYLNQGVTGAVNAVAGTISPTRFEVAVNGSDVSQATITAAEYPTSGVDQLIGAVISIGGSNNALQSITIYDALPTTAGLSALSETGVENTAPSIQGWNDPGNFYAPADLTEAGSITVVWGTPVDAEGNPLTYSVIGTGNEYFYIEPQASGEVWVRLVGELGQPAALPNTPMVYELAFRATDPGGLYVEQEFTITVTA